MPTSSFEHLVGPLNSRYLLEKPMQQLTSVCVLTLALALSAGCGDDDPNVTPTPDTSAKADAGVDASVSDVNGATDASSPPGDTSQQDTHATTDASGHDAGPSGCVSDLQCDDGDDCTIDTCDAKSGFCANTPDTGNPACGDATNSPCEESDLPGTSDAAIESCVCDADAFCCENKWDSLCVNAAEDCGALCGCKDPAADLSCSSDTDCGWCNSDANLCAGKWTCNGGTCVDSGPVVCDTSADSGCLVTECNIFSGECGQNANDAACEDDDFCTQDSCDDTTGQCLFEALEGCGTNTSCQTADTPGSSDADVTTCVCEKDSFCCSDWFGWAPACVALAQEACGVNCDCATLPPADLACSADTDCDWCGSGNPCDGAWGCVGGTCQSEGPTVCDASGDKACLQNICNPDTIHCEMTVVASACDDDDPCTADSCDDASGACTNEQKCGTNSPCEAVTWPGSGDPAVTECVCNGAGQDPFCCENAWDSLCVSKAEMFCDTSCDCTAPETDLACSSDDDCSFCNEDVCEAHWTCVGNTCTAGGPLVCESAGDQGCLKNTCVSSSGSCSVVPSGEACDDNDACTADQCDGDTGACINTPIPGCLGEPTFECKGAGEPSAIGCELVATYEGCCDPWGRALWCGTDPTTNEEVTYCLACATSAPFCGWTGVYYACGTDGTMSEDAAFPAQCPGLDYAP